MRIISWNVNGLRGLHKKGLFVPFVKQYQPDILCLQETKAEKGQAEIDLSEYEEYWNSSAARKGYSGTAIFTKLQPENVSLGFPEEIVKKSGGLADTYGDPNKEGRIVAAEFKDLFVVTVYTPNSKPDLSRLPLREQKWDPAFLAYCKQLEKKKPVIFCGDLNVAHTEDDLAQPKLNKGAHGFTEEERSGIDRIIAAGFTDTFRMFTTGNGHYSWWSNFGNARARNIGWRIDYFFVSDSLKKKVTSAKILSDVIGSDHCPILLELDA